MTALAKLFRATAFKLTLAILGVSAVGAGLVLGIVAWQVIKLVDAETTQTIEAEANGLAEQYEQGGVRTTGLGDRGALARAGLDAISPHQQRRRAARRQYRPTAPRGARSRRLRRHDLRSRRRLDASGRRALARIFALPGGFRLLVGHDLADRARIGAVMVRALATSLIFLAGLAALGALFVARRVLRRIDAMNSSARAIMAGDLSQRLPVSGSGDELDRLALGLNEMLARIADLMAGLREVSDNIAHDLRTPLTRLRNHVEEALRQDADASAYRAALERTIEESDGLIRIFDALLMIARAEAGADRAGMSAFDVGGVVTGVAELYEPARRGKGVRNDGRRRRPG